MDAHNQENKAGPQNESSPVFRGGPISQSDRPAQSLSTKERDPNPYRLEKSMHADNVKEQQPETSAPSKSAGLWRQIKGKLFKEKEGESNTRQKVMIILIPMLFIIMIFMFRQVLFKAPKKSKGTTKDDSSAVALVSGDEIDWKIPEPIPMEIRDPIKPGTQTDVPDVSLIDSNSVEMLSVRGILYSQDKPSAVIGNRIVHLNDKIDDATIVEINSDVVVFEKDGKRWTKKVADLRIEQKEQGRTEYDSETDKIR